MIIDAHCHIYPDRVASRAVAYTGSFYGMPLLYDGTDATLRRVHDEAGISHAVIFSVATRPSQSDGINRFIAQSVEASGGRYVGLGTVHPDSETLKEDIESIISLGLRGVKLHPDIQRFKIDDYRCLKIYELCEGRLPVLLHCGDHRFDFSNPNRLRPILEIFTELDVIGAHFGGWSVWEEAENMLSEFPNFSVDTSSSLYALTPEKATEIIRRFGADRVMFATDYPMWRISDELARIDALGLTDEEKESILYKTAARRFGFPLEE